MGSRLKIAQQNGASYELWSEGSIPKETKGYMDDKGIKYNENIKRNPCEDENLR